MFRRALAWLGFELVDREQRPPVRLSDREHQALKWTIPMVRGIEEDLGGADQPFTGIRDGEATSDVLAGLLARAEGVDDLRPLHRRPR